jgi:hypothetical protein
VVSRCRRVRFLGFYKLRLPADKFPVLVATHGEWSFSGSTYISEQFIYKSKAVASKCGHLLDDEKLEGCLHFPHAPRHWELVGKQQWQASHCPSSCLHNNKKFWEKLIAYISFVTYWVFDMTRKAQKKPCKNFFGCWVCILCNRNVITEPLPSNGRLFCVHYWQGDTEAHRQQGVSYT